ncbi:hypothetical protein FOL46_007748 [Perkinsus olseni]|uniref:EF-hand domain-containing protein n=1 Tax=Perkinsus olseni TaxID=32597 RepID=A0A7J6MPK1_PEROL|nr:hypothetical protein FOL46_007748 [Perkinsus olseni]
MTGSPSRKSRAVAGRYPRFELRDDHKAELKEAFDVFDNDGTGTIDVRDLRVALRALGFEPEKDELKRLVGKHTRHPVPRPATVGEESTTGDKEPEKPRSRQQQQRDPSTQPTPQDAEESKPQEGEGEEATVPEPTSTLDFHEFLEIMLEKMTEKDSKDEVEKAYEMFRGESGKVSYDDLKAVAEELGDRIAEEELREMITEADLDGDGLISQEEFIRIILKPVRQWLASDGDEEEEEEEQDIELVTIEKIINRAARGLRRWCVEDEGEKKVRSLLEVIWTTSMNYIKRQVVLGKMIALPTLGTLFTREGVPCIAFAERLILDYGLTYLPGESYCLGLVGPATRIAFGVVAELSGRKGGDTVTAAMAEEGLKRIFREAAEAMSMYRTDVTMVLESIGRVVSRNKVVGFQPFVEYGAESARGGSALRSPITLKGLERYHRARQRSARGLELEDGKGIASHGGAGGLYSGLVSPSKALVPALDLRRSFRARRYTNPQGASTQRSHRTEFSDIVDLSSRTPGAPSTQVEGHSMDSSIVARIGSNYTPLSRRMPARSGEGLAWIPVEASMLGQRFMPLDAPSTESGGEGRLARQRRPLVFGSRKLRRAMKDLGHSQESLLENFNRYDSYLHSAALEACISPVDAGSLGRIESKICNGSWYGSMGVHERESIKSALEELRAEIMAQYEEAVRRAVVDYLLMDLRMRERCRVSFVPVVRPAWGTKAYYGIGGRVGGPPAEWEVSVAGALDSMQSPLRSLHVPFAALLSLQRLWAESYAAVTLNDLAGKEPVRVETFLDYQSSRRDESRRVLKDVWMSAVIDIISHDRTLMTLLEDEGSDDETKRRKLGVITAVLSSHLRRLVEVSAGEFIKYVLQHTSPLCGGVAVVTPERAAWELHACQRDLCGTVGGPLPIPRAFLELRLIAEGSAIAFTTELDKVPRRLAKILPSMVSAVRGLPRPERKLPMKPKESSEADSEGESTNDQSEDAPMVEEVGELWYVDEEEPLILAGMRAIEESVTVCAENAEGIARLYEGYVDLLTEEDRAPQFMVRVLDTSDRGAFARKIRDLTSVEASLLDHCPSVLDLQLFRIDSGRLHDSLVAAARAGKEAMREAVVERNKERCIHVLKRLEELAVKLRKPASTEAQLAALERTLGGLKKEGFLAMFEEFQECLRWQDVLSDLDLIVGPEELSLVYETAVWLRKIERLCSEREDGLLKEREVLEEKFSATRRKFEAQLEGVCNAVDRVEELGTLRLAEENLGRVAAAREKVDGAVREAARVNEKEVDLGYPVSPFEQLKQAVAGLEACEKLWGLAFEFNRDHQQWTRGPLFYQEPKLIDEASSRMLNLASQLEELFAEDTPPRGVVAAMKSQLEEFRESLPLIRVLCWKGLAARHWEEISDVVGFHMEPDPTFTLSRILDMDVGKHVSALMAIGERAAVESRIAETLKELKRQAAEPTLKATRFGWTSSFVLSPDSVRAVRGALADHLLRLDGEIMKVAGATEVPGLSELRGRRERTLAVGGIIDMWVETEREWKALRYVLDGKGADAGLPGFEDEHFQCFGEVDERWRELMMRVHDSPLTVEDLLKSGNTVADKLRFVSRKLELLSPALGKYMEAKRHQCPRLFFLYGDSEMLNWLGSRSEDPTMGQHAWKLFGGAERLWVDEGRVLGMEAAGGSKLEFEERVEDNGDVADFVRCLQNAMQSAIRSVVLRVYRGKAVAQLGEDIPGEPLQVVECSSEVSWAAHIEGLLRAEELEPLRDYCGRLAEALGAVVASIRNGTASPAGQQRRLESLAVMTVQHHDVVERLCGAGEGRVFFWQSQLKYSIDEEGRAWVETLGFRQPYCYEYIGERGRMVMTPTTLRGYHTMFLSLRSFHGTMIDDRPGSGKGALVRDLSRALGRPLLELVCSERMSFSLIERVLKGMAGGGALCLVKDADKLTGEVLPGLFDTLHRICSTVSCGESELVCSGRSLPLMTTFGYFLTVRDQRSFAQWRRKTCHLLRPLSRVEPDIQTVAGIGLRMAGYSRPWELSRGLSIVLRASEHLMGSGESRSCCVALLKRILERLPSQEKASMGLQGEVVRALEDVLLPRLRNAGDAELVKSLARELLAGSPVECSAVVAEPDVSQHSFDSKAVKLSDMLANRRGVFVTGPPCSGKSTMIAAAAALSGLSSSAVFTVCAGAYCAQEILGSSVWGSGLVTSLLRDHDEGPVWIVLDGCPVSAVEGLALLLENGSHALQSGDRIRVNPGARVLFEVPDLGLLSPALVGRCAVVALGDELTWAMVLDGWCPEGGDTDVVAEVREGVRRFVLGLEAAQSAENGGMLDEIPLGLVAKNSCKLAWALLPEARNSASAVAAGQQRSAAPFDGFVQRTVMYAAVWSVCSFLGRALEDWHRVERVIRNIAARDCLGAERSDCHLAMPSEGSLFDYIPVMDASGWLACRSQLNGGCRLLLLPTAPQAGALALLPRLAASSERMCVVLRGPRGCGKSTIISSLAERPFESRYRDRLMIMTTAATGSNDIQKCLEEGVVKRTRDTFGSAGGEGTMVVIEDLHLAKQVEGVQPAVEFLRGVVMTRGWLDRSAWRRVKVEGNVHWVVSMTSPLNGGSAGQSQGFGPHSRLLKDAITIGLPSVSNASMEAIYSEVISRVFLRGSGESTATLRGSTGLESISNVIRVYREQTGPLSTSMWRYELGRTLEACSLGEGQALIREIRDDILCGADGTTDVLEGMLPEQEDITAVVEGKLETFRSVTDLLEYLRRKLAGTAMSSFALWPDMVRTIAGLSCVLTRANGHVTLLGEQPGIVGKAVVVRLTCFLAGVQLQELDASDLAENVCLEETAAVCSTEVVVMIRNSNALTNGALQSISRLTSMGRTSRSTGSDHGGQGEARAGNVHVVLCVETAESGLLEAWARRFPEILKTCVRLRQKTWTQDIRRIVLRAKLEAVAGQFDELHIGKMIDAFLAVAEDDRHLMTLLECFSRLFLRRKNTLEEMLTGAQDCCDRLECIVQWIEGTRELFAGGLQPHALGLLTDRIHAVEGSVDTAVAADAAENAWPSLEAAEAERAPSEDALAGPRGGLDRANRLTEVLESARTAVWEPQRSFAEANLVSLAGDALLSALLLTSLDGDGAASRVHGMESCKVLMERLGIPYDQDYSLARFTSREINGVRRENPMYSGLLRAAVVEYMVKTGAERVVSATSRDLQATLNQGVASGADILVTNIGERVGSVVQELRSLSTLAEEGGDGTTASRVYIVIDRASRPVDVAGCVGDGISAVDFSLDNAAICSWLLHAVVEQSAQPRREKPEAKKAASASRLTELRGALPRMVLASDETLYDEEETVTRMCEICEEITQAHQQLAEESVVEVRVSTESYGRYEWLVRGLAAVYGVVRLMPRLSADYWIPPGTFVTWCKEGLGDRAGGPDGDGANAEQLKLCISHILRMLLLACDKRDHLVLALAVTLALESLSGPQSDVYHQCLKFLCGESTESCGESRESLPEDLKEPSEWLTEAIWRNFNHLERLGGPLLNITASLCKDPARWNCVRCSGCDWPCQLSDVEKAVVLVALDSDCLSAHLQSLVSKEWDLALPFTRRDLLLQLTRLPPRVYPITVLYGIAARLQYSMDIVQRILDIPPERVMEVMSLASIEESRLEGVVTEAASSGRVVFLRDADYGVKALLAICEALRKLSSGVESKIAEGFRIILTVDDASVLPSQVLEHSVKVSVADGWVTDAVGECLSTREASRGCRRRELDRLVDFHLAVTDPGMNAVARYCHPLTEADLRVAGELLLSTGPSTETEIRQMDYLIKDIVYGSGDRMPDDEDGCLSSSYKAASVPARVSITAGVEHESPGARSSFPNVRRRWGEREGKRLATLLGIDKRRIVDPVHSSSQLGPDLPALAEGLRRGYPDRRLDGSIFDHILHAECEDFDCALAEISVDNHGWTEEQRSLQIRLMSAQERFLRQWIESGPPREWALGLLSRPGRLLIAVLAAARCDVGQGELVWRLSAASADTSPTSAEGQTSGLIISALHVVEGRRGYHSRATGSMESLEEPAYRLPAMLLRPTTPPPRSTSQSTEEGIYCTAIVSRNRGHLIDVELAVEDGETRILLPPMGAFILLVTP